MMVRLVVLLFATTVVSTVQAQAQAKSSIEGVWKVAELQLVAAAASGNLSAPGPGVLILTNGGHYSFVVVSADKPRASVPTPRPGTETDADKLALYENWRPFTAHSGTYAIKGDTVTFTPMVAKNESVMHGASVDYQLKASEKELILTQKPGRGMTPREAQLKLTRLE